MYKWQVKLRVRYAETDQMGFCYYGNYAQYFEVARVEALRNLGVSYKELEDQGIMLPVTKYSIDFIAPAHYDEELTIEVRIEKMPGVRISFTYDTKNQENKIINRAITDLVFVNSSNKKPIRCPHRLSRSTETLF